MLNHVAARRPLPRSARAMPLGVALLTAVALALGTATLGTAALGTESPPRRVAHAGGGWRGETYWNNLEALEASYAKGFRAFELDFHWSADGRLVLVHDWGRVFRARFGPWEPPWLRGAIARLTGSRPRPTLHEFLALGKARGFTPLSLERLAAWLAVRPEARVITDVKEENLRALARIRERYPRLAARIIPQVYRFAEYGRARALGYPRVILTLYRLKAPDDDVIAFAARVRPWAVTLPRKKALESGLAARLHALGVFVYAHTINDAAEVRRLAARGVSGVYSDFLPPRGSDGSH